MTSIFRPPASSDNELVVYDLLEGSLVHATRLPTLATERYMLSPVLSPAGRFFAITHPRFPLEVRSSDTGKLVVRAPDNGVHYGVDGSFVDDTHYLYAAHSHAHQRLTDLTTGRVVQQIDLETPDEGDRVSDHVLSPDHRRVALALKRAGGSAIAIWNLDDRWSATYPVPLDICPLNCTARWTTATIVVASAEGAPPPSTTDKLHINAEKASAERVSSAVPSFAAKGFEVFETVPEADAGASSVHVVTPHGARVELPDVKESRDLHPAVFGDQLLIWRENFARVIAKDGAVSELVLKSTKPAN
jgi:hypothetical protein